MDVPIAVLFGMVSMFGYGISNVLAKRGSERTGAVRFFFLRETFTLLVLFFSLTLLPVGALSLAHLPLMLFIALAGYAATISFYRGLEVGKVGIVSPIGNSALVFTVLFSVLFFGEVLAPLQILAIGVIVAGIILISLDFSTLRESSRKLASGVSFALVTMFLWGLLFFLLKIPVDVMGPVLTSFLAEFLVFVFAGLHNLGKLTKPDIHTATLASLAGFSAAFGVLFFNLGISMEYVSIVAPVTFANPLVAVSLARALYGEKLKPLQYVAALLIVAGIVALAAL